MCLKTFDLGWAYIPNSFWKGRSMKLARSSPRLNITAKPMTEARMLVSLKKEYMLPNQFSTNILLLNKFV